VDNNRGTILGSRRPVVLRARRLSATPRRWRFLSAGHAASPPPADCPSPRII